MKKLGIIFCGKCNSTMVDSGFKTPSTLKCCECKNEEEFKVGVVVLEDNICEEILLKASKDANIDIKS